MDNIKNIEKLKIDKASEQNLSLADQFISVRKQTLEIVEPLETEDYVVQTEQFMSPPRWHLGHLTWFYDQLLRKYFPSFVPHEVNYDFYFNSYYLGFGDLFNKSRRGTISRPTVKETLKYWNHIDEQTLRFMNEEPALITEEVRQLFKLGFNHEYQHQELLVYDLQHLLADKYIPVEIHSAPVPSRSHKPEMIKIPGGLFSLGFDRAKHNSVFAYDIEMPVHKVYLNDFLIDKFPVTNGEYLEFIEDGGYTNYRNWLSEGWDAVKANRWHAPLYWQKDDGGDWIRIDFTGVHRIRDIAGHPVVNVSYFEADAYARWRGMRLPSEAEWEKSASFDEDRSMNRLYPWGNESPDAGNSNLFESKIWSTAEAGAYPKGSSYYGCEQMIGDCWEWTSSEFMPYPGFKSGFAEYNDKWFNNQKVLRGGSFGTPRMSTKNTYRNFFKTHERWMIAGFRCAANA